MTVTVKNLFQQASHLKKRDRAQLASLLLESLETKTNREIEAAWMTEVQQRVSEIDAKAVELVPWEDVKKSLLGNLDVPYKD